MTSGMGDLEPKRKLNKNTRLPHIFELMISISLHIPEGNGMVGSALFKRNNVHEGRRALPSLSLLLPVRTNHMVQPGMSDPCHDPHATLLSVSRSLVFFHTLFLSKTSPWSLHVDNPTVENK